MPQRTKPIDDRALAAIIDEQVTSAVDWYNSDAAKSRTAALKYFEGDETLNGDVPLQPGRSKVVSRDMSDVHGWIMPSLLRTFLSSDRVVVYEPRRPNAEDAAKQATDYVNYVVLNECSGYSVLHSGLWDGLTGGNGLLKHWWDDTPAYETESLSGITEAEYIRIGNEPDVVKILEHKEYDDPNHTNVPDPRGMDGALAPPAGGAEGLGGEAGGGAPGEAARASGGIPQGMAPGTGQSAQIPGPGMALGSDPANADPGAMGGGQGEYGAQPAGLGFGLAAPKLHDLKIKRRIHNGCLKVVAVPPEEFRIDKAATKLDEDHVRFCAHVDPHRTRSSLIVDFPGKRDIIDTLPARNSTSPDTTETIARNQSFSDGDTPADKSTDLIEVWECYLQLDQNNDGVAEWRRVVTAAGPSERAILLNEEWGDLLPFSDLVPDPMPHRWRGGSLYEEVGDIQRIKTVLLRGIYDNMYWVNNPLRTALEGQVTPAGMDVLGEPKFGDVVVIRAPNAVVELPTPFVADKLMAGLDLADKIREFRTGVSAATMSLDPEALQNQTATAVNAAQTASYTKVETYARNIAEGGMKRLFRCILKLIVKHQDQARTIRLRGEWVEMDPRGWDADMDVTVNVGLGSGSRDRDMGILQPIIAKMELVIATLGPQVAAQLGIGPDRLFEAYRKFVEAGGIKQPESYFPEITPNKMQAVMQQMGQQKPDPKMAESQAKIQVMQQESQAKLQADQQRMQIEQQSRQQQAALDWQHKQQQAEIDNQNRASEIQAKGAAMMQELQMKHQLAVEQAQHALVLKQQELQANSVLKARELEMEAELKREEMAMRPKTPANIQQASA